MTSFCGASDHKTHRNAIAIATVVGIGIERCDVVDGTVFSKPTSPPVPPSRFL